MYHLTFKKSGLVLCLAAIFGSGAVHAVVVPGATQIQNFATSHANPGLDFDLVPDTFIFVPNGAQSYDPVGSADPTVVTGTIAGDTLSLVFGQVGSSQVDITGYDGQMPLGSLSHSFTVTVTNAAPVAGVVANTILTENAADQPLSVSTLGAFTDQDMIDFPAGSESITLTASASNGALMAWDGTPVALGGNLGFTVFANQYGSSTVTVTATDAMGASTNVNFTVDVTAVNDAPVLGAIGDQSGPEESPLTFTASATDIDLPANTLTYSLDPGAPASASIDPVSGAFSWTPVEGDGPGSYGVTVRVTDDGIPAQEDSETITLTVDEVNVAPVLAVLGSQTVGEGSPLTFTASATDADTPANTLTYSLDAGAPAGASIDPVSGAFSWTPVEGDGPGSISITVRVTDDGVPVLDDSETLAVTINEVNEAPVLAAIGDQSGDEGTALTFNANATDPDAPANNLTYSLDPGAPAGASIDPVSGAFSWTPVEGDGPGTYGVTVRVTDDGIPAMEDFETITLTVDEANVAPVLAVLGSQTVGEGSPLTFTASATDADTPANTLTYSLDAGAPAGASIDPVSGAFSWTPVEGDGPGSISITVRVTDNGTPVYDDFEDVAVTINEVNEPPVLGAIGDQSVNEGVELAFSASATDPDAPANTLTYSLDPGAPAGAIIDPLSGAFSWTPTEADGPGTPSITIRVTDDGVPAMDSFETITVTVDETNVAPVLGAIGDRAVDEETLLTFTAAATDADTPANTLTYSLGGGAPAGATIDPVSGLFNWTPAEADGPGTFSVTIQATDDGVPALGASETITVTVNEINDVPTLTGDVPDQAMDEDDGTLSVAVLSEFDDVDLGDTPPDVLNPVVISNTNTGLVTVTPSGSGVDLALTPNQYGVATIVVGARDSSGAQATDSFILTVDSINDPVQVAAGIADQLEPEDVGTISINLLGAFSDLDLSNGGDTHTVTVTSSDNGLITPTNSPVGSLSGSMNFTVTPNANGVATITVVAEDAAGTQATVTFDLTIAEAADPPFVANPIGDMILAEDPGTQNISLAGVFDDPDLGDGDVQNYTVSTDNGTLVSSATVGGSTVTLDFGTHQNGVVNVTVTVTDSSGQMASDTFEVTVTAVNDDPTVIAPIADINALEDDPTTFTFDLATVFEDVDILTNSDVLSFSMSNSNASLFDVQTLAGSVVTLHLGPDQSGNATISVLATDTFGATATDSFDVIVGGVNDFPVAADDFIGPLDEDPGLIVIPVLANDYLAEQPTVIGSAGVGGVSEGVPTIVLDAFDDPIAAPNGTVTVNGTQIEYLPKDDFFGTDYFYYTIVDVDGDVSPPARVEIQIVQVNDPPEGIQQRTFSIYENQTLTVDPTDGVFTGSYDVDGALVDGSGNPVGSALAAVLSVPPAMGSLTFDNSTGGFQFTPPINFNGEISFFYRLFDGVDVSAGAEYEVRVVVNPTPPAPLPPPPGTVAITYNISNVPLEQTSNVPPNVLVVMDDSGSMDWNLIVAGADENGGFVLDNSPVTSGRSNTASYVYLWDLRTNAYPSTSQYGRILPTEEALDADSDMTGNQYGVWRARNYKFNSIYYNPSIMYRPWVGQDINNDEFTDADPAAIRLEPRDPSNTFDMLSSHSYRSASVPEWDSNGGTNNVDANGTESLYIPRYYTTAADAPLGWNDPHTLVEILPANAPWPAANGREDCASDGDPASCSYTEELQNFANWFQYYRSREYVTKGSIGKVISEVQDIRIGYETISNSGSEEVRLMNELYTEGDKKLLLDNVYDVDSYGGTPLRQALGRAGQIFACQTGNYCPALPAPDGMCQQNFALLFSDGYWNGGAGVSGDRDDDGAGPFDGGRYADNVAATLGDVAMYYYETDLQTGLDNEVPLARADVDGVPSGTFDATNNTMHQHMKTYSIAFGVNGTFDPDTVPIDPTVPFTWSDPFDGPLEKIDDMVHAAVNGRGRFMSARNPVELQAAFEQAFLEFTQAASSTSAAAFNSTSLRDGTLLYRGFFDLRDNTGELTATVVNTDGTLAATPTWRASEMLNPGMMVPNNRTLVTAHTFTGDGIPFRHSNLAPEQQLMMSEDEVDFIRGERNNEAQNGGVLRERPALNGLLGDIVNSSPVFVGTPRAINRDQAPFPTADLYSAFAAARFSRRPVVYVGANDGIMHGFDAQTGLELFGFVPNKIMDSSKIYHNDLEDVTSPFYQHKYFVDLTPSLNDVYMRPSRLVTGKEWVTLMVGGLGAGGKGLFALNVTDPDAQYTSEGNAAGAVLWEFTDDDDTYPVDGSGNPIGGGTLLDPAGRPIKDLGISTSQPTLTMSNVSDGGSPAQNEWVAVLGNGLNSTAGIAKLFVLFVGRGVDGWDPGDFVKIDTGVGVPVAPAPRAGYPNGLGTPTAVDVDLNGTVDWVYAGDRLGNLYRFDLTDPNPNNWDSTRIFTASYTDGGGTTTIQPILSKPVISKHPTEGGFLITFGTGSHIAREDANSRDIQSIYTIWDRGELNPATAQSDTKALRLVEQVLTNVVDDSLNPPQTRRILTSNVVNYVSEGGSPGVYGWYIDLDVPRATLTLSGAANPDGSGLAPPDPQFPGEKAIRRMLFRDGTIIAATVLPSVGATTCFGARPGSILLFDALSGGNPVRALVDFNNDGYVNDDDLVNVNGESYSAGILFDQEALDGSLVDPSVLGGEGDTDFLFISGGNETTSFRILDVNDSRTGRLSWQEMN